MEDKMCYEIFFFYLCGRKKYLNASAYIIKLLLALFLLWSEKQTFHLRYSLHKLLVI